MRWLLPPRQSGRQAARPLMEPHENALEDEAIPALHRPGTGLLSRGSGGIFPSPPCTGTRALLQAKNVPYPSYSSSPKRSTSFLARQLEQGTDFKGAALHRPTANLLPSPCRCES